MCRSIGQVLIQLHKTNMLGGCILCCLQPPGEKFEEDVGSYMDCTLPKSHAMVDHHNSRGEWSCMLCCGLS